MKLSVFVVLVLLHWPLRAGAHDADAYGGLYRSRDAGATWLPADAGLFINASNAVAISPTDSNHLLYGTDTRLMRSQNGGRDWHVQTPELIVGPIFCAAFDADGKGAYAANANGLFRGEANGQWHAMDVPLSALPIAQIAVADGKVYLAGNDGVYSGNANGQDWSGPAKGLPEEAISALLVADGKPEDKGPSAVTSLRGGRGSGLPRIHALVAGRIWRSEDGGGSWRQAAGNWTDQRVDNLGIDLHDTQKLWAGGASRLFRSIDGGKNWQAHGKPLPDPNTSIRGIAAAQNDQIIVLTTHRGLLRSADGAATWAKVESALPLHLEPSPLTQDRNDPNIVYAGFSLRPYNEAWRAAQQAAEERRSALARRQIAIIVAVAIALMLAIGSGFFLRRRALVNTPRPLGGEG